MTGASTGRVAAAGLVLAVRVGDCVHGIPIDVVDEVLPALPVEPLPNCPAFVRGVVFVRGQLIPVLDAAERLGMAHHHRPDEPHIVCLKTDKGLIGLEVDEALDLIDAGSGEALSCDELAAGDGFFTAVVEREGTVIRILDSSRLVNESEAFRLEQLPGMSHHSP